MMMVQALRPKITRNSGYISTSGAEAIAAIQVSVASRTRRLLCSSTPSEMPTTLSIRLAASASPQVSRKRGRMFSSTMMRSKLITMSVGFGTMKGLIMPILISPSISGNQREQAGDPEHEGDALPPDRRLRAHGCLSPARCMRASSSLRPLVASSRRSPQICAT